ncbi:MAG TPA: hypothetical protein VMR52_09605 [Dehalococcoidia bacterium]|nr:hypothetical protein [Dehalococcoidia bacterium]
MCLSCGCKQPNEAHGDDRNITIQDIQAAAEANGSSTGNVVKNIQEGFQTAENAGASMGHSASEQR